MPEFRQLIDGYRRFRHGAYADARAQWAQLAQGQEPPVMIVACCDSRVDPSTIFSIEPGQAFIVRNVANLVPPYEVGGGRHGVSAALSFAVNVLKVRHIVVMGHASCGGIAAALRGAGHSDLPFIADWIDILAPAVAEVAALPPADQAEALEREAVRLSLANLRSFPFIAERIKKGAVKLHGCHFGIAAGELTLLDEESGQFTSAMNA